MAESTAIGFFRFRSGVARSARSRHGRGLDSLLAWYGAWLSRLNDGAALREIEPRMARDIGVAAGTDRCPQGFAVDPRPLWGIGLTPRPTEELPPWTSRRTR
jgi:hypothetical protein